MDKIGTVITIDGDNLTVKIKRTDTCDRCGLCLNMTGNTDYMQISAINECAASLNDRVIVRQKPQAVMKAAAIMYGLPLAGFLSGCLLGWRINPEAGVAFVCGVVLAAVMYGFIKRFEPKWDNKENAAVAVKVLD